MKPRVNAPSTALWTLLAAACLVLCLVPLYAADSQPAADIADPREAEFFESKIRPLLAARCFECHGADKQKGGLRLDSRDALKAGGDSGSPIVSGKPEESLLVEVVGYRGEIKMPPKSKLPDPEIALLTEWVRRGAHWPGKPPAALGGKPAQDGGPLFTDEQRRFWAFQPVEDPQPSAVKAETWVKSPLDRFILAELEANGLAPAPPASKHALLRRATFDLTGLPSTPEEITAFIADEEPDAFARVVDRLLASPRYGERWGRHWLDVARYADSNGLDENLAYANAWHYRDYVVEAFNRDLPFDRFVQEQIVGDLLTDTADPQARQRGLIATGFLCLGAKMLAEDDPVKMQMDIIDEQVDTIGRAFLGLTLGCARCHDHKYDPVPTADYYSLAGIFKSTKTMENFSVVARWQERPLGTPEQLATLQRHQHQIAQAKSVAERLMNEANEALLSEARRHVGDYLLAAERYRARQRLLAETKPRGDDALKVLSEARLIEAEAFARGNVLVQTDGYGAGIGVVLNKGEVPNFAEYDVDLPRAGWYQLETRYAAAEARPVRLSFNGDWLEEEACRAVTGSWYPDKQKWEVAAIVEAPQGRVTLRLECAGPFPHIDKLLIVPVEYEGDHAPIALAAKSTRNDALRAPFIRQWAGYLDKVRGDNDSPFAVWSAYAAIGKLPGVEIGGAAAKRLVAPPVGSLEELAARYNQLGSAAEAAWREVLSRAPAAKPEAPDAPKTQPGLDDPALEALRSVLYDPKGPLALPEKPEAFYPPETAARLQVLRDELAALDKALVKLPEAMAVSDAAPQNLRVHLRGSHLTLGDEAPRRFLRIIAGNDQPPIAGDASGRLQLAQWITRPDNPLTSRVLVNRVWHWHFGEGLVRSPDNFGALGERPTHPQLLDWLARRFVESGWSLKALHRMVLLSSTYQMSTAYDAEAAGRDPDNRLWWRMNRRRLEAEAVRDGVLAAAGTLDNTLGGSLLPTPNRQYVTSTANVNPVVYDSLRRSIYLPVVRSALYEMFTAFDFADPSTMSGKRESTIVASQALFMMNSQLVAEQSRALASQLCDSFPHEPARVVELYLRAYGRPATDAEVARALEYVDGYERALVGDKATATAVDVSAWTSLCRAVLSANEFVYVE